MFQKTKIIRKLIESSRFIEDMTMGKFKDTAFVNKIILESSLFTFIYIFPVAALA